MTAQYFSRRDIDFLLYEVLDLERLCAHSRFQAHDRQIFDAILDTASAIAVEQFAPHAAKSDAHEPRFDNGHVHLIPEIKAALDKFVEAGLMGATFDESLGGLQLPMAIGQSISAMMYAANIGTAGYPLLTLGAANLLSTFGSAEQKDKFVKPMIEGRWFGTM